jgi:hypothetical protein
MKKTRVHRGHHGCHASGGPHGSLLWIALGVLTVATLSAAPWLVRARTAPAAGPGAADDGLRQRTAELVGYASSIRLTPEQEKVKADALSAIKAPCGNRNSLAVRCCGCNLFRSIGGLANHMIAREGADGPRVRQAVLDWIGRTNSAGYSGAACDRKRCERPFREDGCGGMSEARLAF